MDDTRNLISASALAAIAAGPIFVTLATLLMFQEQASAVTHFDVYVIPGSLLILALASLFGLILAFPTCLLVGGALSILATPLPLFRSLALWLLAAGGTGFAMMTAFGFDLGAGPLAFIFTAIACAAIVRTRLHWD